jgi:ribosome-binding ATPase YchF (GTP1/OBG family)
MSAKSRCPIRARQGWLPSRARRDHSDAAHFRRHRRPRARRVEGRRPGQPVPRHIREVDAVAHVLRCFEDDDITHVEGGIDPLADAETVETELMLADLDSLEKRVDNLTKKAKRPTTRKPSELDLVKRALEGCAARRQARARGRAQGRRRKAAFRGAGLLTAKPVLYVCNVEEGSPLPATRLSKKVQASARRRKTPVRS